MEYSKEITEAVEAMHENDARRGAAFRRDLAAAEAAGDVDGCNGAFHRLFCGLCVEFSQYHKVVH